MIVALPIAIYIILNILSLKCLAGTMTTTCDPIGLNMSPERSHILFSLYVVLTKHVTICIELEEKETFGHF